MMKQILTLFCCLLFILPNTNAQIFKCKKHNIELVKSTYSHKTKGTIGCIGDVYEFTIKTKKKDLIIDSVWFGRLPVPCDLYKDYGGFRVAKTAEKGIYYVHANKNLYECFAQQYDSSLVSKNFKPIQKFEGVAMIMYQINGKRYYQKVPNVTRVEVGVRQ